MPLAGIFSFTIMTYFEKFIGIKSLNTNQCPTGLSSRIIPCPSVSPSYLKTATLSGFD